MNLISKVMNESIAMPGFPQIIVTRHWAYQWLTSLGWDQSEQGFGSLDYTIFASKAVPYLPMKDAIRNKWLNKVKKSFRRD